MHAYPSHLANAAKLLAAIQAGNLPAERQVERFFRTHRNMGSHDRALVADMVYGCLRQRRYLEYLCDPSQADAAPLNVIAAYLVTFAGWDARQLEQTGFDSGARDLSARIAGVAAPALPFAVRASLPDWLADRLCAQFGELEAEALAAALNQPAPVDLRVNTLKTSRAALQRRLADEGITTAPMPFSPVGLRCVERAPLLQTGCYQEGLFELQDEGSQLISYLIEPRRQELIADFCAGAGGKSLHLGVLMANTGTVYAFDTAARRLGKLAPRLERAGVHNVRPVVIAHEDDAHIRRLQGKFDRVLVDAPCSGTGTLRRHPDIKWRAIDLATHVDAQQRILAAAAALVKPGGRLVYATCSVLCEENEDVVAKFVVERDDFTLVPVAGILARRRIQLPITAPELRLHPHRHHTDGFYAAVLTRKP